MEFVKLDDVPLPEFERKGSRVSIYALIDPRADDVRYVGVAGENRPPPCAQDQRTGGEKRRDWKADRKREEKRIRRETLRLEALRVSREQKACQQISVSPTVRRNGEIVRSTT